MKKKIMEKFMWNLESFKHHHKTRLGTNIAEKHNKQLQEAIDKTSEKIFAELYKNVNWSEGDPAEDDSIIGFTLERWEKLRKKWVEDPLKKKPCSDAPA